MIAGTHTASQWPNQRIKLALLSPKLLNYSAIPMELVVHPLLSQEVPLLLIIIVEMSILEWATAAMGNELYWMMWGVAPHRIDAHMRDVQETRRNDYTTSQPHYNYVNVNGIVMVQLNVPERSQNNQHRANKSWPPHSVPNGLTSVSSLPRYEECASRARTNPQIPKPNLTTPDQIPKWREQ